MIRLKDVNHRGVTDLASDMAGLPPKIARDSVKTVRDNAKVGARLARQNAKQTSGTHGQHFPKAISSEMLGVVSFGGVNGFAAEYGPERDHAGGQGNMEFEAGRRQSRPHRPMGKTLPIIRPAFHAEYARKIDGWFW